MRAHAGRTYEQVEAAFLELADPGIPAGLAALGAKGATETVAFPYFLAAGTPPTWRRTFPTPSPNLPPRIPQ